LQAELDKIAQEGKKVAIVAFGSLFKLVPKVSEPVLKALEQALEIGLIEKAYWGVGRSLNLPGSAKHRIELSDWLPQFSMLQHPAVGLFITHAGAESIHESIFSGVPMILIPGFADQAGNAFRVQELGIGKAYHKGFLNSTLLLEGMVEIVTDKQGKYAKNLANYKLISHKAMKNGLDEALDMIEMVAALGTDYLYPEEPPHWIKDNNVDTMSLFAIIVLGLLYTVFRVMVSVYFYLRSNIQPRKLKVT
jgi:UDP:flavonoid glycosyltransferase YjiC (YdhE family)